MSDGVPIPAPGGAGAPAVPREPYGRLFARFLRFGALAWGGPVAQIAMIRQELVDEERWISSQRFNRVYAVYQALPGPEATELAVYFGMLSRGRMGAVLAGLGFVLPGFALMMALSWAYLTWGIAPGFEAVSRGLQAGVAALIVRAVHRIGGHALTDRWLWILAALTALASLLGVHFLPPLLLAGAVYVVARSRGTGAATVLLVAGGVALAAWIWAAGVATRTAGAASGAPAAAGDTAGLLALAASGLRSGLLTFGGAYTVIPFLQHDAVTARGWMSNAEFLDGLALSGLLPAPLIIFATFVGYVAGGPLGGIVMTAAIFAPAFAFTLVGHDFFERVIEHRVLQSFLHGVTAGVVGLISATTLELFRAGVTSVPAVLIFLAVLGLLYAWRAKAAIAVAVVAAGLLGAALLR